MKQYRRSARFNRLLQEEISAIIREHLKDPRLRFPSVTRVESTEDLRHAKVYVSVLEEEAAEPTLAALRSAAGVVRGELMHRLSLRRIPELAFILDRNIAYSIEISRTLDDLKKEWEKKEDEEQES